MVARSLSSTSVDSGAWSGASSAIPGVPRIAAIEHRPEFGEDVVEFGHHRRAVLDQPVAAGRSRIERRARHGEDQPTLVGGAAGGDQRSRAVGGFDDHHPQRNPGNDPVAAREIAGTGRPAERHFAEMRAAGGDDPFGKVDVFGGIELVEPAGEHGDRAGVDRRRVGGGVDAAGEAGGDRVVGVAKAGRDLGGEFPSRHRGVARADDGDGRPSEAGRVATHGNQRRRVGDVAERRRIVALAHRHQSRRLAGRARRVRVRRLRPNTAGSGARRARRAPAPPRSRRGRCRNG